MDLTISLVCSVCFMWRAHLSLLFYTFFVFTTEMMSVIFNYIRVDNDAFVSNPSHVEIVIAMAKSVSSPLCQYSFND